MSPTRALRPCARPGCAALVPSGLCREHQHQENRRRGSSTRQGYGQAWRRARAQWLRDHPLCEQCKREGRTTLATVVDHVLPHRGDQALFWNQNNWQSMCKPDHDAKTMRESVSPLRTR